MFDKDGYLSWWGWAAVAAVILILGALTYPVKADQAEGFAGYKFADKTVCQHASHEPNVELMKVYQSRLTRVLLGKDSDLFQQAWMRVVGDKNETKYDGHTDAIFIYKNYPYNGVFFGFKDGCFVGYKMLSLDNLNKITEVFEQIKRGV